MTRLDHLWSRVNSKIKGLIGPLQLGPTQTSARPLEEETIPLRSVDDDERTNGLQSDDHGRSSPDSPKNENDPVIGKALPEVRAVAVEVDDSTELCETFRAYVLGTFVAVIGTGLNVWFGARQPGIYISPFLAQLLSHPVGVALSDWLPDSRFRIRGRSFSLNPGPWTIKEHGIVVLMATVSFPTATALDVIVAIRQPTFFNDQALGDNKLFQLLVVLSTQFLGFGIAGFARDFLVYPSAMTWPSNLAKLSLFNALHGRKVNQDGYVEPSKRRAQERFSSKSDPPVYGWRISMFRFCIYAAAGSFSWFFVTALGLNPLPTFDWTYISGAGLTPLITPWWATLSTLAGTTIGLFIIMLIYFSNTWFTAYLVPNSNQAFDRFGNLYNVTKVIKRDHSLNIDAYRTYSPLYFGAGYNVLLAGSFALYTAVLAHALINHWAQLKNGFRQGVRSLGAVFDKPSLTENAPRLDCDIHFTLMSRYKEVPQWWFTVVMVVSLLMGIIMCKMFDTTMPIWGIFCCLAMSSLFMIPVGIVTAVSNMQISLVILSEIIPGLAIPGQPYANMIFKLYGWVSLSMALLYVQDLKLAHYLHISPRATFRAQMWGCLISSLVSLVVVNWQFKAIPDLCRVGQKDLMTCPYYTTFYSSALMFGVVGPQRMYGNHGLYRHTLWGFPAGTALVMMAWWARKRWPSSLTDSINVPVIICGTLYFAPYNWSFVWAGVPLAWFFMSYVHTHYRAWWNKYCYILSIGLTIGAALSGVVQFFFITYPGHQMPAWWGMTQHLSSCDGKGCPLLDIPEKGYFGPGPGEYY
ncbi:OPT family small oligopeptide transporter [Kwoniella heveanensis BCC8398]|uniref:OPT family small oligopeptide transporter n=1 Tax=Kwoniella heveanensis BCC8398 TaxID=1296120 RepID=A0A1B9H2A0_9TREE|nr:OPT family small oligopeptide transporter [Kwoniella heveanensis BCC8398]